MRILVQKWRAILQSSSKMYLMFPDLEDYIKKTGQLLKNQVIVLTVPSTYHGVKDTTLITSLLKDTANFQFVLGIPRLVSAFGPTNSNAFV